MSDDTDYFTLLGMISQMPPAEQERIRAIKEKLKEHVDEDREAGIIALAQLGMELQRD